MSEVIPLRFELYWMYRISCKDPKVKEAYIGHTTDYLRRRIRHHRDCTNPNAEDYNAKKYVFIRANGGWDNWVMERFLLFEAENVAEARIIEREFMELEESPLNERYPSRNRQEYDRSDDRRECLKRYGQTDKRKACLKRYDDKKKAQNFQRFIERDKLL